MAAMNLNKPICYSVQLEVINAWTQGGLHSGKPSQILNSPNMGGPPNPDFTMNMKIPDFWGRGGSRTAPIGDPDFIFVCINGQLRAVRGI